MASRDWGTAALRKLLQTPHYCERSIQRDGRHRRFNFALLSSGQVSPARMLLPSTPFRSQPLSWPKARELLPLLLLAPLVYLFLHWQPSIDEFPPVPDLAALNLSFAPSPARIIPPYLHLVHGLSDNPSFTMIDYICFTAALKTLNPEFIFLHYRHDLTGWWWETWLAEVDATKGTELRMLRERDVTSVWGRKVTRTAHKADVIRLEALRYYGGVYIDADVLIVRDLAPLYNVSDTVMALEASRNPRRPEGLCNAVILAKPYAPFIVRWQDAYRTFQSARWNYHSVVLPLEIARAHPSEIKILTPYSFFWPLWTSSHLSLIHEPSEGVPYSFSRPAREQIPLSLMMNEESGGRKRAETEPGEDEGPAEGQYAYHLWSSIAWDRHLKHYTPDSFFPPSPSKLDQSKSDTAHHHISSTSATPFVTLAARWVSADLRDRWRTAKGLGQV